MFTILDAAVVTGHRLETRAARACDQCKQRKVRCDMANPCLTCSAKRFHCTYDRARKKRGPTKGHISDIPRLQSKSPIQSESKSRCESIQSSDGSEDDRVRPEPDQSIKPASWSLGTLPSESPSIFVRSYSDMISPPSQGIPFETVFSAGAVSRPELRADRTVASPDMSEIAFPSLPFDSPPDYGNTFGAIPRHDRAALAQAEDVWPQSVNEETLLPWIDVYFKRIHPTIPILNRTNIYRDMLLRKHRVDAQFGAMLLALCSFAMIQPVQDHERASISSRDTQARKLLGECVKMRTTAEFGENPSIETILASFFLFACLFGCNYHGAARHRLREAVDLAHSLGLHMPQKYEGLDGEMREQWLRTYLVLSVTERAYALQQRLSIDFRGRPSITARFMQSFNPTEATEYISSLIYQDHSDAVGMTGLLYLMETFDAIDENVIDCWNGYCRYSDGKCESFDRRRALQMFRAQHWAREACLAGNISFAPSATPLTLGQLAQSQQADISMTQFWLLNRLWNLCLSHGLLRDSSDHAELHYNFACHIARALLVTCRQLDIPSMEVHGVGLVEKIYDVAMGIITALDSSPSVQLDMVLTALDLDVIAVSIPRGVESTVLEILEGLGDYIQNFRGGDHPYSSRFLAALHTTSASANYQKGHQDM